MNYFPEHGTLFGILFIHTIYNISRHLDMHIISWVSAWMTRYKVCHLSLNSQFCKEHFPGHLGKRFWVARIAAEYADKAIHREDKNLCGFHRFSNRITFRWPKFHACHLQIFAGFPPHVIVLVFYAHCVCRQRETSWVQKKRITYMLGIY